MHINTSTFAQKKKDGNECITNAEFARRPISLWICHTQCLTKFKKSIRGQKLKELSDFERDSGEFLSLFNSSLWLTVVDMDSLTYSIPGFTPAVCCCAKYVQINILELSYIAVSN